MNDKKPKFGSESFVCPHCCVLTQQKWILFERDWLNPNYGGTAVECCKAACFNCNNWSIWINKKIVYPLSVTSPISNINMPENVKKTYNEARKIVQFSPRASAALLRFALEELTIHLGENNGTLYERIVNLEKCGLNEKIIKSLHIVRITANEGGAHPGQIDLKDNERIVNKLFDLINFIVEKTITDNQKIDEMFQKLPENKKKGLKTKINENQ